MLHTSNAVEPKLTGPYGPVEVKRVDHVTTSAGERAALSRATSVLGRSPGVAEEVLFSDQFPFGEFHESRALLFSEIPVEVSNGNETETVAVSVATNAETGAILCVFTQAKVEWIARVGTERDPEAEADHVGWNVGAGAGTMKMTAAEVLGSVWQAFGIRPSEPAQIVLRPRSARVRLPQVKGPDGTEVEYPSDPDGPAWVVQILGRYDEFTPNYYWTGRLILVDDLTERVLGSIYLP